MNAIKLKFNKYTFLIVTLQFSTYILFLLL